MQYMQKFMNTTLPVTSDIKRASEALRFHPQTLTRLLKRR